MKGGRELPAPALNAIMDALEAQGRPLDGLAPEERIFDIAHFAYGTGYSGREPSLATVIVHLAAKLRRNNQQLKRGHLQRRPVARRLGETGAASTPVAAPDPG